MDEEQIENLEGSRSSPGKRGWWLRAGGVGMESKLERGLGDGTEQI